MLSLNYYPILENKRAILRPLQPSDTALLLPLALAEPELFRFMSAFIGSEKDLIEFVNIALEERDKNLSIPFIVVDKHTGSIAGTTRFANIDQRHKRAEIGWTWIASKFHHSGLNKAMKFLMLQHAFETLQLNRIEIKTSELNTPSRRAIESIGGKFEGILRHHMINPDGSLRNTVYYSILKEEWPDLKRKTMEQYLQDWY